MDVTSWIPLKSLDCESLLNYRPDRNYPGTVNKASEGQLVILLALFADVLQVGGAIAAALADPEKWRDAVIITSLGFALTTILILVLRWKRTASLWRTLGIFFVVVNFVIVGIFASHRPDKDNDNKTAPTITPRETSTPATPQTTPPSPIKSPSQTISISETTSSSTSPPDSPTTLPPAEPYVQDVDPSGSPNVLNRNPDLSISGEHYIHSVEISCVPGANGGVTYPVSDFTRIRGTLGFPDGQPESAVVRNNVPSDIIFSSNGRELKKIPVRPQQAPIDLDWTFGKIGTLTIKCYLGASSGRYTYGFGDAKFS